MASTFSIPFIHIFIIHLTRSCSGLSSTKLSHNIAILCSREDHLYNKTWSLEDTGITFNITYLNGKNDSLSLYKTATTLYNFIDKHGVSLIVSDNRNFSNGLIDILAEDRGIPVIKWFNDGLNPLPQKRNTVFYLEPNPASQLTVITQLLQHYGWNRVAIVSDNDDENLKMASSIRSVMERNGSPELLLNVTIKPGIDSVTILKIMKDIKLRAVVLLSQPVLTSALLKKAKLDGLINVNCTWILGVMQTEQVLGHSDLFLDLPIEIIELKFTGRHDAFVSFDYFMEDSIAIFKKALKYCKKLNVSNEEYNFHQNLSKAMKSVLIDGKTGEIQFDANGHRTNLKYDIIYRTPGDKTTDTKSIVVAQYARGTLNMFYDGWPPRVVERIYPRKVFRVSLIELNPYVIVSKYVQSVNEHCPNGLTCFGRDGKIYCCFGYCIDLLKLLTSQLGFKVRLHVSKDGKYGSKNSTTGQWSGLIGELVRGDADIALADLTISKERSKVVDFTESFIDTGIGVLVKVHRHHHRNNLDGFTAPFNIALWIGIIILIHVVLLCMWTLERLSPYGLRERAKLDKEMKYTFSLGETVWYTWSLILPSFEFEMRPKSVGTRCITVCFSFCLIVLITSYTANLAAFLVVEHEVYSLSDAGIRDPKLQNRPADFAIGTVKGSFMEHFFKTSIDPIYGNIWKHMRNVGVNSYTDGINQLLSEKLDAFVYDHITIVYEASTRRDCDLKVMGRAFVESSLSIALSKDSSLTSKISKKLRYYKEYNIEEKLRKNWFRGACRRNEVPNVVQTSIQSMSGLFLVVCIGIVVAIINCFLRHCISQFCNLK